MKFIPPPINVVMPNGAKSICIKALWYFYILWIVFSEWTSTAAYTFRSITRGLSSIKTKLTGLLVFLAPGYPQRPMDVLSGVLDRVEDAPLFDLIAGVAGIDHVLWSIAAVRTPRNKMILLE